MQTFLERLGMAADVSRITLVEQDTSSNDHSAGYLYQWVSPDFEPHMCLVNKEDWLHKRVVYWQEQLIQGLPVQETIEHCPQDGQELLTQEHIQSLVIVPIFVDNMWWGCLELADCRQKREWMPAEVDGITTAAGIVGAAIQRQQLQNALVEREEELRKLHRAVEQSPHPIVITNIHGVIEYVNYSFTQVTGYTANEAIGKTPRILKSGKTPQEEYATLWRTITAGKIWRGVFYNRKKNGDLYWDEATVYPVTDNQGIITHFLAIKEDITDRKKAEKALCIQRDLAITLSTTRDISQALKSLLNALMLFDDLDAGVVYAVDKATGALALVEYNGIEEPFIEQIRAIPADSPLANLVWSRRKPIYRHRQDMNDLPEELLYHNLRVMFLIPIRHEDRVIAVLNVGSHTYDEIPMSTRTVLETIATQIGEIVVRVAAEEELKQERELLEQKVQERTTELTDANKELARAARIKDQFLSSVSHELRTPLNAVIGLSDVLMSESYGELNPKQREYLDMIQQSGQRLNMLINGILDFSRLQSGKEQLLFAPLNISNVCQASLQVVRKQADHKQIELILTMAGAEVRLVADERRVKQMLVHLLDNAIKFTPEKGSVGLDVKDDPDNDQTLFVVWDTGIGIAPSNLQQLFQLFQQLDGCLTRQYGGVGLGLAVVARLAEMHGGTVKVESEEQKGSRFTICLPWKPKAQKAIA
jgi:PAS domain S-box-containing protein